MGWGNGGGEVQRTKRRRVVGGRSTGTYAPSSDEDDTLPFMQRTRRRLSTSLNQHEQPTAPGADRYQVCTQLFFNEIHFDVLVIDLMYPL
jgi:hypothetical protein